MDVAAVRAERQANGGLVQEEPSMFLPIDQSLQELGRERVEWIRSRINLLAGVCSAFENQSPSRDARSACHSILNPKPSSSSRRWQPAGRGSLVPAIMVGRRTTWLRCCGLRAWRYSAPRRYSRRALAQRRRCPSGPSRHPARDRHRPQRRRRPPRGHRHVAMRRARADHKGVRIFMRPRRPRATCSSPRRGARGVIELR